MALVDQWDELQRELPLDWGSARLSLRLARAGDAEAAAALLAPLQPLRTGAQAFALQLGRGGEDASTEALRRALARLDARRLGGALALEAFEGAAAAAARHGAPGLEQAWRDELATLPSDWSDLLGEIELDSSDYLDRAAVHLAPINPRRSGEQTALRFRSARSFGYGAAPGVVGACLARCDRDAIRGHVRLLRVLCDTRPVGTQGPVWHIDGEMV